MNLAQYILITLFCLNTKVLQYTQTDRVYSQLNYIAIHAFSFSLWPTQQQLQDHK